MNFIKRWIRNVVFEKKDTPDQPLPYNIGIAPPRTIKSTTAQSGDILNPSNPLRLSIAPANGGVILAFDQYDLVRDRNHCTMYVVHDGDDIGSKIGEVIAMELLKK